MYPVPGGLALYNPADVSPNAFGVYNPDNVESFGAGAFNIKGANACLGIFNPTGNYVGFGDF